MASLLTRWLAHYDPIHRGWTPAGIANGVCAACGFFFPRIRGGYNLRRAAGGVPDSSARVAGAAGADATAIRTFPWVTHAVSTDYVYRLAAIGGGGVEAFADEVIAATAFDEAGHWVGARPNAPGDLRVEAVAGGRFRLRWTHTNDGEQAEPARFNVYHDGGSGSVDLQNAAALVDYVRGRFHYAYVSAAFGHGLHVRWVVRAESPAGVEEKNEQAVGGRAEALGPPVNPTVALTCFDV